jgi:hypothetical protein
MTAWFIDDGRCICGYTQIFSVAGGAFMAGDDILQLMLIGVFFYQYLYTPKARNLAREYLPMTCKFLK